MQNTSHDNNLFILWTSDNIVTADQLVLTYARDCSLNAWWSGVTVILWGASAQLVCENAYIQDKVRNAAHAGVRFSACRSCAEQLGAVEKLQSLDIELAYWSRNLTELLQNDQKVLVI